MKACFQSKTKDSVWVLQHNCVVENTLIYRVFEISETLTQKRYKEFLKYIFRFAANFTVYESNQGNISREIMQCQACEIVSKDINEKINAKTR